MTKLIQNQPKEGSEEERRKGQGVTSPYLAIFEQQAYALHANLKKPPLASLQVLHREFPTKLRPCNEQQSLINIQGVNLV